MFLKSIEMQGFKSFADKTKVEFTPGVTAVVGPNGSGKSNITESLRWALGESSAKSLRGGKMPDVIFAGTQSRSPLNFASVRVVLDNSDHFIDSDFDELSVERRIYRNGDSDYLIDGRKVRLRDIHELFMDTGLGRDSFSIISQGRVEEIFNSKAEERRAIFEEAAGVLKYKTRKKETESKLKQTQDNLDRLEDIIYELEKQEEPLAKQAEKAKQYQSLDKERYDLELQILVHQTIENQALLKEAEKSLQDVENSLSDYYSKRERLESKNNRLKAKRHQLQKETEKDQTDLLHLTQLMSQLEKDLEIKRLESDQSQNKRDEASRELEVLTEQKESLNEQILEKQALLEETKVKLEEQRESLNRLNQNLSELSQDPDQIIEQLREKYVNIMQEEVEQSNRLTQLKNDANRIRQQMQERSDELAQLEADLTETRAEAKEKLQLVETSRTKVKELLDSYQARLQENKRQNKLYQETQANYYQTLDEIKTKRARLTSLESIQKNHSNFYAGVKAVLQAKNQLQGIIGAVSEHVSFAKDYQTAMEIVLSASGQNVIVEDETAAKTAINYLKKNRQGRATFLPLTTIKSRSISASLLSEISASEGFIGLASDLTEYEARLAPVMENLLATTAIFDHIDHATMAARRTNYRVRIVTLDGTELRTGGAFSGGANRNQNSLFIKPEMDALKDELAQMDLGLKEMEHQLMEAKATVTESEVRLNQLKEEGNAARLEEQAAQIQAEQLSERLADLQKLYDGFQSESVQKQLAEIETEREAIEAKLIEINLQKDQTNEEIELIKRDKDSLNERLTSLRQEQSELQLSERDLQVNVRFTEADLTRLRQEYVQLSNRIEALQHLIKDPNLVVSPEEIERLEEQLKASQIKKDELEQTGIRRKFEFEDIEAQLEEVEDQLLTSSQENDQFIREQSRLESLVNNIKDKLRGIAYRLAEDYHLSFENAREQVERLEDLALAEMNLKDLQAKIKALGPVNIEAIEQYEELKERLDFLLSQRDDVLKSRDLLNGTISEMDQEVIERFKETFEAIRESFKVTFSRMFGGGSADLLLTSDDLLTAGVEISVQPPGKKIQSLNLMSGGEKALSALALLFAIIRVKTIPFVILDEVEAALDEANVKRFGDYLNQFDENSQFIVVTHRKGTMAAADTIYGVTMQESGVSRILSVKLKEANDLIGQ